MEEIERAAVYLDNNFSNELTGFKVMKVQVTDNSRVIGAPVESGQTSFDNKVIDPMKVVVNGIIVIDSSGEYKTTINKLKKMADNRNFEFYSVTDGMNQINNLILQTMPTIRDPDRFDFVQVEIVFVEALLVQSSTGKSENSENSDFRSNGNTQGVLK